MLTWLNELDSKDRAAFDKRLHWAGHVDRLAQAGRLEVDAEKPADHYLMPHNPAELGVAWCEAWQGYLAGAARYLRPEADVTSLQAHHEMLLELGGNLFCLLPGVDWSTRRAIAHFGALDRFFTDLENLERDLERGRCPFPRDVLARFGLSPRDFSSERVRYLPGYQAFMSFWFNRFLPTLEREAAEFSQMPGLPPALQVLRAACLRRHAHIEQAFRRAGFDFVRAETRYGFDTAREDEMPEELRSCA